MSRLPSKSSAGSPPNDAGTGTAVRINDELRGTVAGNAFYRALLKVWLGDKPVSKPLKKAMLGSD